MAEVSRNKNLILKNAVLAAFFLNLYNRKLAVKTVFFYYLNKMKKNAILPAFFYGRK